MANRLVFLTFLGTSDYIPCNYVYNDRRIENVRYVQEALVRLEYDRFRPGDMIVVFLTNEAKKKNWEPEKNDGTAEPGLRACLDATGLGDLVKDVDIPSGASPAELWAIFDRLHDKLQEDDEVILDITHAFRYMPMLGIVMLNYARMLKRISIEAIYYGAFEVLGHPSEVARMAVEDRNAPIFDLTDFATLMEWTSGVQEFVRHGNPAGIAELLEGTAHPRLRESRGGDATARLWRSTADCLQQIAGQIATNRGKEIVDGASFVNLRERLAECADLDDLPRPFRPLIDNISHKIDPFVRESFANCLHAARWCHEHGLVQQGVTILQEGVITVMAQRHGLDWQKKEDRNAVSDALVVVAQKKSFDDCRDWSEEQRRLAGKIKEDPVVAPIASTYQALADVRNDINHGGFVKPKGAHKFKEDLRKALAALERVFSEVEHPTAG